LKGSMRVFRHAGMVWGLASLQYGNFVDLAIYK